MPTRPVPSPRALARALAAAAATLALASGPAAAQQAACPELGPLEERLKASPADAGAMVALGRGLLCAGRYRDAQRVLEEATRRDYPSFDAHFYLGQALFQQGDLDGALFEYGVLAKLHPARLEPQFNRGVVLARLRRTDDAIRAFQAAVEAGRKAGGAQPFLLDAYVGLAGQQRAKGDFDGAARTYADALAVKPGDPALTLGRAQALVDAGKGADALPLAYELLNKDPNNVAATLLAADVYAGQKLTDRALRELERGLGTATAPRDRASLLLRRGLILNDAGRKAEAVAAFRGAADADPESWEAQYNLAALLLADKPADALERFRAAARLRPEDGETQLGLASAHDALKGYAAAYAAAKAAVPLLANPNSRARARFLAGKSAYLAGKPDQAAEELRVLAEADPRNATYLLWYGLALYAQKDTAGAVRALEAAVRANPNLVEARTNLGAVYLAARRFAEAESLLRQVVTADPRNADALANLGLALANLGRTAEAREVLQRASELGSASAKRALAALGGK